MHESELDWNRTVAFRGLVPAVSTMIPGRTGHVVLGLFAARKAARSAARSSALDQLWALPEVWLGEVRGLAEGGLPVPVDATEPFAETPMDNLSLHVHRSLTHRPSEACLMRDLHLHTAPATNAATR